MRLALLVNPAAGRGDALKHLAAVEQQVRSEGLDPEIICQSDPDDTRAAVARAVGAGIDRLIVVGGDGLINMALQHVAQTSVVLGIVPAGTGNDFARGLGISTDLAAATTAALGEAQPIDAMRSSGRWAASIITQGFSVTTNQVANRLPWPRDGRRYVVATGLALPALKTVPLELDVDGVRHELENTFLAIGNTRFFGSGTPICPAADPTNGLLDIVAIGPLTRRELITFYDSVPDQSFLTNHRTKVFSGSEVTVKGGATGLWADGEQFGSAPMTISVVKQALHVAGANLD